MSLLYTNNKDQDIVQMIAAEVSSAAAFMALQAARPGWNANQRTLLTANSFFVCLSQVHVGTQNCNSQMASYVYDRTRDGVFYLDLAKTWEKAMVAARIIAAIQDKNPQDVLVSSLCTFLTRSSSHSDWFLVWSCFLSLCSLTHIDIDVW